MIERAISVYIMALWSLILIICTPLNAQEHVAAAAPQVAAQKIARVLQGPDPNAIYLKLQPGRHKPADAPRTYIHQARGEVIMQMTGFLRSDSPGDPALPYQIYRIALPPEAVAKSLRIETIHLAERKLPGEYRIVPAPPYFLDQEIPAEEEIRWEFTKWGLGKEIVEGHNILIYEKDAFYPAEYSQVISGGQLRKWKIATIVYYPIRYNPVKAELVVAEEVVLKIGFDRDYTYLKQKKAKELLRDDTFDERARELFLNYDQARPWYLRSLREGTQENADSSDPDYAIITTEDIYTNSDLLDDFCFHKQDLGFSTMVVTEHQTHTVDGLPGSYSFADAGGGYEDVVGDFPNHRPERIRKWLQNNYLALGIEYVLLVGNPDPDNIEPDDLVGDVPMQLCWINLISDRPADLYYSDLSGDWNLDGDDYVGEWYPETDPLLGYSYSNLPAGVTGNLFCVRWDGVVEIAGATGPVNVRLNGYTEGQTKIWFDADNDGINEAEEDDVILPYEDDEHHPNYYGPLLVGLTNGTYQIIIKYTQSSGDAYCSFTVKDVPDDPDVSVRFKHDDGTETYVDRLEARYFNDNDFSVPPDAERLDFTPRVEFIMGGDRGVDGVDFHPEVIVGRIPFYGEDEDSDGIPDYGILDGILAKTINYENADIHDETWRRRVLASLPYINDYTGDGILDADILGVETLMNDVAPPPLWEWYRIHEEDYGVGADVTDGCTIDKTVEAWNDPEDPHDGRGVVMWRTHGSQTGASKVFHETRCADLDDLKPSMVIQTTCQNGHPEVEEWGGVKHYPLGYSLLKQGAIATISSSRNSGGGLFDPGNIDISYKSNHYLLYFLSKGIFSNNEIGRIHSYVRENDATLGEYWGQILNYDLFGDPSVSLFGRDPEYKSDVVFLLDGSGSMVSPEPGKWQAAVDAALLFRDLMESLRHPTFDDRYGSVVFRWLWPENIDGTTTVPLGTGLQDISVPLTVSTFNPEFTPESPYSTPMGLGLQLAADQFDMGTEESLYTDKMIILLSDGKHNEGMDPLDVIHSAEWPGSVKVFTVGLGEDDIEPETIKDIAHNTYADYRISPSPREIEGFFCEILCGTSWKLQDVTVTDTTVPVDQGTAVFIVVWDDPAASLSFDLDPPGPGPNITPTTGHADYPPMEVDYHGPGAGENHAFYVCRRIDESGLLGEWHFANINDGATPVPLGDVLLKVIEDPRTIADFDIDDIDHYTGQPIILAAEITEDGKSKVGLTEVYAELIRSPAHAVGTLMANNSPPSDYPAPPSTKLDRTLRSHYLLGVMKAMDIESLIKQGGPRVYLRDDGLGVDPMANDGVYTGVFQNTQFEGSYTFRFRARGENKDGVTFDRNETLSEYVKFAATPEETEVEVVSVVALPQEGIIRTTVKVTPRDGFGAYLGPFRSDAIQLWSSLGSFEKGVQDHKDGSYGFILIHPIDTSPLISVSVGDVIVVDRMVIEPQKPPKRPLISLHGSVSVPLGNFSDNYETGFGISGNLEFPLTERLSLRAVIGSNWFEADLASLDNTRIVNINSNIKYNLLLDPVTLFIETGPGYYILNHSSEKAGISIGAGFSHGVSPSISLDLSAHYHAVFTSSRTDFLEFASGIAFEF